MTDQKSTHDQVIISQGHASPALVYLARLAPSSRRTMHSALVQVVAMLGGADVETMPWHKLRYEHLQAIRAKLAQRLAPATANRYLAAIRGVLRESYRLGEMPSDAYHMAREVDNVKAGRELAGRALDRGELAALLDAARSDPTDAGTRDLAILAVAYAGGLRRTELANLQRGDLTDDGETISLQFVGKWNRQRTVYLDNGAAIALRAWLAWRGDEDGRLFYRGRKGGRLTRGAGLTAQAIFAMIKRRAAQAGVENVAPHDLRRTFITDLLEADVDLATVAAMAGHSDPKTTARYDRRGERAKRAAAARLTLP